MVKSIGFEGDESKELERIFRYYTILKRGLIALDQVEPEGLSYVQPYNEIRHAVDHLSRVILFKLGLHKPEESKGYNSIQLDKSFSHMYRAVYDTLDLLGLTIKEAIDIKLKPFSLETRHEVMPDFYSKILPRIYTITEREIVNLRVSKDVGDDNENNIVKLEQLTEEMSGMLEYVNSRLPALSDYENKRRKSLIKNRLWQFALAVIGGGALTAIGMAVWNALHQVAK